MKYCLLFFLCLSTVNIFGETMTNEAHNCVFRIPPSWDFLKAEKHRPFDAVRLYPLENNSNKRADSYIAARVFLLAYPKGIRRLVEYARDTIINLQQKYFTVITREQRRENDISLLYYKLFQHPGDTAARDMWIEIRFFSHNNAVFAFYAAAHTESELNRAGKLFESLKFLEKN